MLADSVSGEGRFPGSYTAPVAIATPGGRARELSRTFFIGAPIPSMRASPSWPNRLPNVPPPNIITVGVRISIHELGGHTHSDQSTP